MLHSLTNPTREALLQQGRGNTALALDALYVSGFKVFQQFSFEEAFKATRWLGIPGKLLRAALRDIVFSSSGGYGSVSTLPTPTTVRKAVGAPESAISDELPDAAYQSISDYRKALHVALIERRPGIYSRLLLARRLGVTKRTIRLYDKILKIWSKPNFRQWPITAADIDHMPIHKRPPGKLCLVLLDEDGWIVKVGPWLRAVALKWLSVGGRVEVQEQLANEYRLTDPGLDYVADGVEH